MHVFTSSSYRILLATTCICFLSSHTIRSQGITETLVSYLNAVPTYQDPAAELGLLPDTPSYYVVEELYNADTLTRKGTTLAYYNYGDIRYEISSLTDMYFHSDKIVRMERINDTFSLQTVTKFEPKGPSVDSTLVWWKDGMISRASRISNKGLRIDFNYTYQNGKLVHQVIRHPKSGDSDTWYTYNGDQLVKMVYHEQEVDQEVDQEVEIEYTDTLITLTSIERGPSSVNRVNSITHLDKRGKKLSVKTYMQLDGEPESRLYQSEDYLYYPDGGYQMTATQHNKDKDYVSILEFHPDYIPTRRWTWEGSNQVWVKNYMHF